MASKRNPGAFDCYAAAHPDEEMFDLLGRDRMGGSLVRLWAAAREQTGEDPAKVSEAHDVAARMDAWCRGLGKAPVDVLDLVPFEVLANAMQRRTGVVMMQLPHEKAGEKVTLPMAPTLVLTGKQVKDLLEYIAPDESEEQLEAEVAIGFGDARAHAGPGMYAWSAEYPEEGSIPLFETTDALGAAPELKAPQ